MDVEIDKATLNVIGMYKDALLQELNYHKEGMQTEAEMKLRLEKHKDSFGQLYRGNEKIREEFDHIYHEVTSNIGS